MAKDGTFVPTTSETYNEWVRLTKATLLAAPLAARVWKHVNTSVIAPSPASSTTITAEEAREIRIHTENEEQALGIILEQLDPANACLAAQKTTAKDVWDELATAHNQRTGNRQYQLYQRLATIVQKPGEPLPDYFQRLEHAADLTGFWHQSRRHNQAPC